MHFCIQEQFARAVCAGVFTHLLYACKVPVAIAVVTWMWGKWTTGWPDYHFWYWILGHHRSEVVEGMTARNNI